MRVLRQIAELARYTHFAGGGQHVAGDHAGERGLAGALRPTRPILSPLATWKFVGCSNVRAPI